jgi:hypothetical protein
MLTQQTRCDFLKIISRQISDNDFIIAEERESGTLEVLGTGQLKVINTGGSSASEGGMGSSSDDDREKGELSNTEERSDAKGDGDGSFDPIKKNVKEKEKQQDED